MVGDHDTIRPVVRRPDPVQRVGSRFAGEHHGLAHEPAKEPQVRDEAEDDRLVERSSQAFECFSPIATVRDDLGQHRVEPGADLRPEFDAGIDPDPVPARPPQRLDAAGRREESVLGVLGVEADFDRVPGGLDVGLREPQGPAGGDPQLIGDEVTPGDGLRHGMFHLEAGVHLEERRLPAIRDEELAGAGADIPTHRWPG